MKLTKGKQKWKTGYSVKKCLGKMMAFVLASVMLLGSTLSAQAAAAAKKVYTVKDVFDAEYYANTYSDVKDAAGTNKNALYKHYNTVGKTEGRSMCELIDVEKYKAANADLNALFGDDNDAYVNHYIKFGFQEGRKSFGTFDARAYADRYPDLKAAFGYDVYALYKHYMDYGRAEGRNAAAVRVIPKTENVQADSSDSDGSGDSDSSDDSDSDNDSDSSDDSVGTDPIVTRGRIINPETGSPVANATVTFTKAEFHELSEIVNTGNDETGSETGNTGSETENTGSETENTGSETGNTGSETENTGSETDDVVTEDGADSNVENGSTSGEGVVGDEETDDSITGDAAGNGTTTGDAVNGAEDTEDGSDEDDTVTEDSDGVYIRQTDEDGYYEVPDFIPGVYSVEVEAENYMTLTLNSFTISESNSSLPTFELLTSDMSGANTISGTVMNATTAEGIGNATINIRSDWNNRTGEIFASTVTDENGVYSVELERGYYTIEFVTEGYVSNFINVASSNSVGECNCPLNPSHSESEVTEGQFRIVLTWGELPYDLDSHLVGPDGEGGGFHVYFPNKVYEGDDGVSVTLDVDDVTSYGPETVTILNINTDKTYYYSVKDFSNGGNAQSTAMSESGAKVEVYNGSELMETYYVPQGREGFIWNVFKIENGRIVTINDYNADETSMYGEYFSPALYGRSIVTK